MLDFSALKSFISLGQGWRQEFSNGGADSSQFFLNLIFYHAHPFRKVKKEKEYLVTIIKKKE